LALLQVRLQVFNTQAHAYKQISALECTARILKAEGVCTQIIPGFCISLCSGE